MQGGAYLFVPHRGGEPCIAIVSTVGGTTNWARFFTGHGTRIPIMRIPITHALKFGSFHPLVAMVDPRRADARLSGVWLGETFTTAHSPAPASTHTESSRHIGGKGYIHPNGSPGDSIPIDMGMER